MLRMKCGSGRQSIWSISKVSEQFLLPQRPPATNRKRFQRISKKADALPSSVQPTTLVSTNFVCLSTWSLDTASISVFALFSRTLDFSPSI